MKIICAVLAVVLAGQLAMPYASVYGSADAKRLYDDLLSNYNRLIRPVGNNSDRLTVKMGLKLSQLIEVVSDPFVVRSLISGRRDPNISPKMLILSKCLV